MSHYTSVFVNWLRTTIGRGLAGLSAFATLIWFLWPSPHWEIHPDALCALLISFGAWIASMTPRKVHIVSKHDVALLEKFRAALSDGEKSFLRTQDFGGSFSWHSMEGLEELSAVWRGAEYEFDDKDVQLRFEPIIGEIREFMHKLSYGSWAIGQDRWSSVLTDEDRRTDNISGKTAARIKEFNERATKLIADFDEFVRFARVRLN